MRCTLCKPYWRESELVSRDSPAQHDFHTARAFMSIASEVEEIRCPYCVLGVIEFRPMIAISDEVFICKHCGHSARPFDEAYECHCMKCWDLRHASCLCRD